MNISVSFKIVKLLEKIGWKLPYTIEYLEELQGTNNYIESIPTIAEVVMWLYEKHGIWIKVDVAAKYFWHPSILNIEDGSFKVHPSYVSQKFIEKENRMYNSPTEAYSAAIEYTLNNLI